MDTKDEIEQICAAVTACASDVGVSIPRAESIGEAVAMWYLPRIAADFLRLALPGDPDECERVHRAFAAVCAADAALGGR
ncbi:hypothetical protein [Tsukamurella paurometabola]|uniref:Uncharacterized protein n=1 Tax=Tsukamurella paurometabola TaxID=2061 RepID=A0A3P8KJ09_TSUPA|nr:hypothetical protein [Tsukamurella paurometabola]UEA83285.1 hypothetical protein LK411_00025 [Tsukamurella paurometabola]VDR40388.1 Uncharacterised protein [Tsukamurella paurometabola]